MADDEGGAPAEPLRAGAATPNRGKPREAPLIEQTALPGGEARHASDEVVGSDPAGTTAGPGFEMPDPGSEAEPEAGPTPGGQSFSEAAAARSSRPAVKRRSRVAASLALLTALVVLLFGGVMYALYHPPMQTSSGAAADLDGLKQRVDALERQPVSKPVDLSPLGDRITELEATVATLKTEVTGLGDRVEAAAKPAAGGAPDAAVAQTAPPAPTIDLAPVQDRLATLEGVVKNLQAKASAPAPLDPAPVAALTQEVAALKSSVASLPRVDLAPVKAELADLGQRVAPLESALATPKTTQQVTEARQEGSAAEARAAPLAVTGNAVLRAINAGKPFTAEMTSLKALGVDDAKLAPLAPFATTGAPTVADLLSGFDALADKLTGAGRPVTGNVLDRLLAGAQGLVKVRQTAGATAGNAPEAVVSRIEADLRASDLPAALTAWTALPADGQAASQGWADRLKARIEADRAAQAIVADAIAAIGSER